MRYLPGYGQLAMTAENLINSDRLLGAWLFAQEEQWGKGAVLTGEIKGDVQQHLMRLRKLRFHYTLLSRAPVHSIEHQERPDYLRKSLQSRFTRYHPA
jgi:hypothetical protein